MIQALKQTWTKLRSNYWLALLFDIALIAVVFFAIHAWQTRDLPIDELAPETILALLDGSGISSAVTEGETGIVYFFAPWCFYCRHSIGNLDDLAAEKCLRINLMQRVGYLAVGDLDGVPYIKMCENLPYAFVGEQELDYTIRNVALTADKMEQYLEPGEDIA